MYRNFDNNFILWNYFNIINLKETKMKNIEKEINKNLLKKILKDTEIYNKNLLIENIEFLSKIFYIENKEYNFNTLNKFYKNKIVSNKLIDILYNYDEYQKNNIKMVTKFRSFGLNNFKLENTKEESINQFKNIVEANTSIIDFLENNKK